LVLPNVTKGKIKLSMLQPYWPYPVTDGVEESHLAQFHLRNPKDEIVGVVELIYCSSQKQALDAMLLLKLLEFQTKGTPVTVEDKCSSLRLDSNAVGEVALIQVPDQDEYTNPIPGTGEAQVYFVRNNTAVALRSIDPKQSMLKMAKAIDAVLKGK